jgi:hypothetical protein
MEIKPVRNAKEHKAALAEVEGLWDAKPGSSELVYRLCEAEEAETERVVAAVRPRLRRSSRRPKRQWISGG